MNQHKPHTDSIAVVGKANRPGVCARGPDAVASIYLGIDDPHYYDLARLDVTVDGRAAEVIFAFAGQVNARLPEGLAPGTARLRVNCAGFQPVVTSMRLQPAEWPPLEILHVSDGKQHCLTRAFPSGVVKLLLRFCPDPEQLALEVDGVRHEPDTVRLTERASLSYHVNFALGKVQPGTAAIVHCGDVSRAIVLGGADRDRR